MSPDAGIKLKQPLKALMIADFDFTTWLLQQIGEPTEKVLPLCVMDQDVRQDGREYLLTNGLGSYSSASISGANTRRYHALFCVAETPPTYRRILFSRVDETLRFGNNKKYELATNFWKSGHHSRGYRYLRAFAPYPVPSWCFEVPEGMLIKQVVMPHDKQEMTLGYAWIPRNTFDSESQAPQLELKILVNNRDFHAETKGWSDWKFRQVVEGQTVRIQAYDTASVLCLSWNDGHYQTAGDWYWAYHWPRESERGLNDTEDLYLSGTLTTTLTQGSPLSLTAQTAAFSAFVESIPGQTGQSKIEQLIRQSHKRHKELHQDYGLGEDEFVSQLARAADDFVVSRASTHGKSVIAGYHWFGDWGRDTMISLPGLTLPTKRHEDARSILRTFGQHMSEGMLPNNFPDAGEQPSYNTSDATFWWACSLYKYYKATRDLKLIVEQFPLLEEVVEWHVTGTRYGLHVDREDFLITSSDTSVQLTWMDAKCGDFVVTPRTGKAVEINALWYNFLRTLEFFWDQIASSSKLASIEARANYGRLALKAKAGFAKFWNADRQCLFDVIKPDGSVDPSIRCNQLFAASLPFKCVSVLEAQQILAVVDDELLTPAGLRTLSPKDEKYQGQYGQGLSSADQFHRDLTYHQGTVWPWLLGAYIDAVFYAYGDNPDSVALARYCLAHLEKHIVAEAGIGSISEIFDGDPPHKPQGCIAQAWSVAEILRVISEHPQITISGSVQSLSAAPAR